MSHEVAVILIEIMISSEGSMGEKDKEETKTDEDLTSPEPTTACPLWLGLGESPL